MTDYHLLIIGLDGEPVAGADLDCDDDQEAVATAQNMVSPYGHALFAGRRFLGHFGASWGEHLMDEEEPAPNALI